MVIVEMTESEAKRFLETTKVKVTPEESEQIQKFAFRLGYEWEGCGKKVVNAAYPYLYFDVKRLAKGLKKHRITCGFDESVFENSHKDELRPNDIFSVKISYPFDIVLQHGNFEENVNVLAPVAEVERLSKLMNKNAYVLSACMEVETEQIVHKIFIEDMNPFYK